MAREKNTHKSRRRFNLAVLQSVLGGASFDLLKKLGLVGWALAIGKVQAQVIRPQGFFRSQNTGPGNLWAWGRNAVGSLGDGSTTDRSSPVFVGSGTTWSKVNSTGTHGVALKSDNSLFVWGSNSQGELGDSSTSNRSAPAQVSGTWVDAAGGYNFTYGIKTGGTLWTWGSNSKSQLGVDSTSLAARSSPVQVGSDTNWASVVAGYEHGLAVKSNGSLWAWGDNYWGQLGNLVKVPVQVGALNTWSKITSGANHALAIKTDGTLWAWGWNYYGQVGDGTTTTRKSPVQIAGSWIQISASGTSTLGIKSDGTLWGWGLNDSAKFGVSSPSFSSPVQIGAATTWSKVSNADTWAMATRTDGTLWTWGANNCGQLGYVNAMAQVGALTNWAKLASAPSHTIAIKTDGTLWGWGYNERNALSTLVSSQTFYSPVQIGSATDWSEVAAGASYGYSLLVKTDGSLWTTGWSQWGETCGVSYGSGLTRIGALSNWSKVFVGNSTVMAVKTDGTLWGWGTNSSPNNIVDGSGANSSYSSPVQIGAATNWSTVSLTGAFAMGLRTDGTLWAWGANGSGQLGLGNTTNVTTGPTQVGGLTTWSKVAAGYNHSLAVKTDGTLWSWGNTTYGQLGSGSTTLHRSSPVQVGGLTTWSKVYASFQNYSSWAIKTDGTLWAFGDNTFGQLGNGVTTGYSSPVQIGSATDWSVIIPGGGYGIGKSGGETYYCYFGIRTTGALWSWGDNGTGQLGRPNVPTQVGALTTWSKIATGSFHALATKTDGTLWSWGWNDYGQLGSGTTTGRYSPVQVGGLTNWSELAANGYFGYSSMAVKTDGTVWGWGWNSGGLLGTNNTTDYSSPVQIGALTNWSKVFLSSYSGMAVKADGTMWAWGNNAYATFGNNTVTSTSSPVQIGSATNWSTLSLSQGFTLGLKTDGTLWSWGTPTTDYGQLGYVNSQIGPGETWSWAQVSAGGSSSAGIQTNGTLWTWGQNTYGQLGDGTQGTIFYPTQVGAATNWAQVSMGGNHALAVKTNGTLWAWGFNIYGQLGTGNTTDYSSPVQVGALTNWSKVAACAAGASIALKTDGTIWAWGDNAYGMLGLGDATDRSSPVQIGSLTNWTKISAAYTSMYGLK